MFSGCLHTESVLSMEKEQISILSKLILLRMILNKTISPNRSTVGMSFICRNWDLESTKINLAFHFTSICLLFCMAYNYNEKSN